MTTDSSPSSASVTHECRFIVDWVDVAGAVSLDEYGPRPYSVVVTLDDGRRVHIGYYLLLECENRSWLFVSSHWATIDSQRALRWIQKHYPGVYTP